MQFMPALRLSFCFCPPLLPSLRLSLCTSPSSLACHYERKPTLSRAAASAQVRERYEPGRKVDLSNIVHYIKRIAKHFVMYRQEASEPRFPLSKRPCAPLLHDWIDCLSARVSASPRASRTLPCLFMAAV